MARDALSGIVDLRRKSSIVYLIAGAVGLVAVVGYFLAAGIPGEKTALVLGIAPFFLMALALREARRIMLVLLVVSLSFSARYRLFGQPFRAGGAELAIAPLDFPLLGLLLIGLPGILSGLCARVRAMYRPLVVAIGVFGLTHVLSIAVARDHFLAGIELLRLLKMLVLVLVLTWHLRSSREIRLVLQVLIVVVVVQGVLAVGQWATKSSFGLSFLGEHSFWSVVYGDTPIGRSGGTMGHPNALAYLFEMLTPISLAYVLARTSRRMTALAVVAVIAGIAGIFVTFSRAGWVAMLVALLLVAFLQGRKRMPMIKVVNLVLVVSALVGVLGLAFEDLIALRLNDYGGASWNFRFETFGTAFRMFQSHPVLGIGVNNYEVALPSYIPPDMPEWRARQASGIAHNFLLLYAAEMGTVGLLSLLALFAAVGLSAWQVMRKSHSALVPAATGILAATAALFSHGQLSWFFRHDPVFTLFWFLVGLLIAIQQASRSEEMDAIAEQGTPASEDTWLHRLPAARARFQEKRVVARARAFVEARPATCLFLLAAAVAFLIASVFPVYFRQDDVYYLEWASEHPNPLSAFMPSQAVLFGMFRPMQNLAWWILYRLFGLQAYGYHIAVLLLYGIATVLFWKLAAALFSRRVAVLALLAYFGVFFYLTYVVFWFSDLTYIVELVFVNLSLYLLVRASRGERSYLWGVICYALAAMSKEPSLLIVPAVFLLYLRSAWRGLSSAQRTRSLAAAGVILASTIGWVLLGTGAQRRQGIDLSSGIADQLAFVSQRWAYYSRHLLSEFGVLIWALVLYTSLRPLLVRAGMDQRISFYAALVASAVIAIAVRPLPEVALGALLLFSLPILARRAPVGAALAWFWLPLLGVMTVSYTIRTYLVEASFGMAIVMGVALDDILSISRGELRAVRSRRIATPVAIAAATVVLVGALAFVPKAGTKLRDLSLVSHSRLNFRDAIEFLVSEPAGQQIDLAMVDYEDMGLNYVEDVLPLGDAQKARRQKTMSSHHVAQLLEVAGVHSIEVHDLQWLRQQANPDGILLLAMNDYERDFLKDLPLRTDVVFERLRKGGGIWIYEVKR